MVTTVSGTMQSDAIVSSAYPKESGRRTIYSAPWNVTNDFKNACKSSKQIPIVLVQPLNKFLVPLADITDDVEDGSVTIDVNRGTRRTLQLRLVNKDGKYTPNDVTDYFYWNNIIRVHRGLRYIASDGVETDEYVCLGTFMVDRPEVFVERNMSVLSVDASDFYKRIATGGFAGQQMYPEGALVTDIISAILKDALISPFQMNIYGMEDRADMYTGTNLVSNGSFETNTTGWDSPVSPTYWHATSLSYYFKLYVNSGATLSRATSPYQAPNGGTYCLSVSGNSCKAAHTTITASFSKDRTYLVQAYFRKQDATAGMAYAYGFIGNSAYLTADYPTVYTDTEMSAVPLYAWPEDAGSVPADERSYWQADDKPWVCMNMFWRPARDYTSAELYFYANNYNIQITPKNRNLPNGPVDVTEVETTDYVRDYYLDSVYVGELSGSKTEMESAIRVKKGVQWLYGDSRDKILQELLEQFSLYGYFDVYGNYIVKPMPDPTKEIPVWTFSPSEESTMLGISRIQDDLQLINHIIITNEGSNTYTNTITASAEITDTSSPYHKYRIGDRVMTIRMSQISDGTTASTAAWNMLRKYGVVAEEIKLPTLCLPFLDGGDIVSVVEPMSGTNANYECQRITIPLRESRMDIESKRSEAIA